MNTDEILRYRKLHIIDVLQNPSFMRWLGNAIHLEVQGEITLVNPTTIRF
jgi:hypothetical protein